MESTYRIFVCYRRDDSAVLGKHFAEYIDKINDNKEDERNFGDAFYSDREAIGNYLSDNELTSLMGSVKFFVVFMYSGFTEGFIKDGEINPKCATAKEFIYAEKARQNGTLKMVFVNINSEKFNKEDEANLETLFTKAGIIRSDTISAFTEANRNNHDAKQGSESELYDRLLKAFKPQPAQDANLNININVEWDEHLADTWKSIPWPSRPSEAELEVYKKHFDTIDARAQGNVHVLILGTTNEFRQLARNYSYNDIYIVDYSKNYCEARLCDLPLDAKKERVIECSWQDMNSNKELIEGSFDIVIGDLAVGNIPPNHIKQVLGNISKLLKPDGVFLGKSIFSFESKTITTSSVNAALDKYFEESSHTIESAYASAMYFLSVYAANFEHEGKIDFGKISNVLGRYRERHTETKDDPLYTVFSVEGDSSFDKKMHISFYVYPISLYVLYARNAGLELIDVEYAKDDLKADFPLLVFSKEGREVDGDIDRCKHDIVTYLPADCTDAKYKDEWGEYLSSQFFLVKLLKAYGSTHSSSQAAQKIVKKIIQSIQDKLTTKISDKLLIEYDKYTDEKIESESETIYNTNDADKKIIASNYELAVLCYLASELKEVPEDTNSVFSIIVKELMTKIPGGVVCWLPNNAPWVNAKVCLCLADEYKKMTSSHQRKIYRAIEYIVENYRNRTWNCEIGDQLDTNALCAEVLCTYCAIIDDDRLHKRIIDCLEKIYGDHVSENKLIETYIQYPIGKALVTQAADMDDTVAYKQLLNRVEWLSILLRITTLVKPEDESSIKFLTNILLGFWTEFQPLIPQYYRHTKDKEIASILQMMYSILSAFFPAEPPKQD